ncbi:hypothetical protein U9M48_037085 [Paspalum notatum var. saurae]|uniref:Integrase catalytic domain-containing protein n=1 Tax=Paspalum notatum var. saurae TaxID=547442 RepID=A0AAQ3UEX6_PASNO
MELEPTLEQEIRKGQLNDEKIKEIKQKISAGSEKMYHDLKKTFWLYGMKREIAEFVAACDICQRVKAEHQRLAGLLQPLKILEWKWEEVGMDFITGTKFTSHFWQRLHESMDTRLNFSSTYHPQTDGQTERTNQILEDMLRACALQYGSSWDKSLPYAEFSYNNSYQASIEKAPFEALYGIRCRTPLHWNQPGEKQVLGPDIIKEAEEQMQVVWENMRVTQSRRRELSFEVGDYVYQKVSPMRGLHRFKVKGKLAPRYIGPFKIIAKRAVHDVFHVSQLKKCLSVPEEQLPMEELSVQGDLTYTEHPTHILETAERVTRNEVIKMCKVKWSHHTEDEATWEREDELKAQFSNLFANQP